MKILPIVLGIMILMSGLVSAELVWNVVDDFESNDLWGNGWLNYSSSVGCTFTAENGVAKINRQGDINCQLMKMVGFNESNRLKVLFKYTLTSGSGHSYPTTALGNDGVSLATYSAGYGCLISPQVGDNTCYFFDGTSLGASGSPGVIGNTWYWNEVFYNSSSESIDFFLWDNSSSRPSAKTATKSDSSLTDKDDYASITFGGSSAWRGYIEIEEVWLASDTTNYDAPYPLDINCSSCNRSYGDVDSPYVTSDIIPTFEFTTIMSAQCRIGSADLNYTEMGNTRNCTTNGMSTSHVCDLNLEDKLNLSSDSVYISCANALNENQTHASSSGELDITLVNIVSNITCTSCNIPDGDNESPYTTYDTTPTFKVDTDIFADCRIGVGNQNYSTMGEVRNCQTTGNISHTCTLTIEDQLFLSDAIVYISCRNLKNMEYDLTTQSLQMDITNLEVNTTKAIELGIYNSLIWPGAVLYPNQKVYLRDLNNNQLLTSVDYVAVYGNQRWLLNVGIDNEQKLGLFNITPVVYSIDLVNESFTSIQNKVSGLINSTKN